MLFRKQRKRDLAMIEMLRDEAIASLERAIRAADVAEEVLSKGAPAECAEIEQLAEALKEANEAVRDFMQVAT